MSRFKVNDKQIHLWTSAFLKITDEATLKKYYCLLNNQEKAKLNRFRFSKDRHQFLVSRALLKTVLSFYHAQVSAKDWRFRCNKYGKPAISNKSVIDPVQFNMAHCDGMIVLAITRKNKIGVDVEYLNRPDSFFEVAANSFSSMEQAALSKLPENKRRKRFLELWTLKESYIKATGKGLSIPLDQFGFYLDEKDGITFSCDSLLNESAEQWTFWQFPYCDEFIIAFAAHDRSSASKAEICYREIVPMGDYQHYSIADIRCSNQSDRD